MSRINLRNQRAAVGSLIREMTGKNLSHLKTGRPFIGRSMDISVSHAGNLVGAAFVPSPYRIGIDLEQLDPGLNSRLFIGPVISDKEAVFLKKFCNRNKLSFSSGIAVLWSIKESFFKCLDYDLMPGKIRILGISKSGNVRLGLSSEIRKILEDRGLKICSMDVSFNRGYIYSRTLMEAVKSGK